MDKFFMKIEKGFTLIELIITIFVISVGLVGVMTLIQNTLQSASAVRSNLTASYLAQEGIELVRNIRDANWVEGEEWDKGLTHCFGGCQMDYNDSSLFIYDGSFLISDNEGFYRYGFGKESKFQRKITINLNIEYLEVKSEVFWEDREKNQSIEVVEHLYNWI